MFKRVMVICLGLATASASPSFAQKKYDTGASDTEIKIGQTMPYSGPLSSYSTIGKIEAAYFRMINEGGGVNGRKITFLSEDAAQDSRADQEACGKR
jgi:branched-chain amino acid transport system substrate-binding protein